MQGTHACGPVVAEEAVEDAREVEARHDEAAEVGDEGDGGVGGRGWRCGRLGSEEIGIGRRADIGSGHGGRCVLKGEVDIYESGDGLDGAGLLCVFDKVALAGLVFRVPIEADNASGQFLPTLEWNTVMGVALHVELRIVGAVGAGIRNRRRV